MVTKEQYLARRQNLHNPWKPYTAEDAESRRLLCEGIRARECAFITVRFEADVDPDAFSVYVDRNIRRAGAMDSHLVEPQTVLARVEPGVHKVVLRDRDPRQPDRRESNTLTVEIGPHQRVRIRASVGGELQLCHLFTEPISDVAPNHHCPPDEPSTSRPGEA